RDYRHPSYTDYSIRQLLSQRIYGLILGYEDLNDHEYLRYDPLLMLALEKLNFIDNEEKGLAGKSTLNRLEYCPEDVLKQRESRYHKIEMLPKEIEKAFVDIFLDFYQTPPDSIIIDMDVTDDKVHGNQEGAFFNKYYKSVCYAPLYIFCGHHFKEQQLDLFADRTSTHHFESNQLRLWLSSMAYVLVQAFRQHCLKKTPLQRATVGTIRLKLFKLGARVIVTVRRILISIASSCPAQDILRTAYLRIMAIPETG
ncbi:MAG: transposase, partial [Microcystaceae cyanobacterium]